MIDIVSFRTEGLGNSTYLLSFDGLALLVDPQRDIDRFLDRLGDARLRWVAETHVHNDYVSGGLSAARLTGAELLFPAAAAPAFRHTPAFHLEEIVESDVTIRPVHTPGHTPEHTSYVVLVEGQTQAVFSGGSLLVGSAGRSDLLGPERADSLARLQYRSVRRLAELPEKTALYPTHGAGSFCTVSEVSAATSTIGQELEANPVLSHRDEESFVRSHLDDLQPYPTYYARMAPINLMRPGSMPSLAAKEVAADTLQPLSTVVDIRAAEDYAAGHFPGSINIPLSDQFGTWFGWLIPPDSSPFLVTGGADETSEALLQLARIGIDEVAGVVTAHGADASVSSRTGRVGDLPDDAQLLDVRSPGERDSHAPPGSVHRYLPDLLDGPPADIDQARPVWVMCSSGYRSAIGASILRRQGLDAIPVLDGGVSDL
jgi:hydroxyacylglutathione hydrolase